MLHGFEPRPGWVAARVAVALATGLTILGTSVACGSPADDSASTQPSDRPAPDSTLEAAEADAAAGALAAYNGFQEAYVAAAANPGAVAKDIDRYAGSPLGRESHLALERQAASGIVVVGRPTWTARVTAVNVTTAPYTVMIEDCFDQSNWRSVYKKSGKSAAAPGQTQRYLITSKAELYADGRWLVSTSEAHRDRPC